MIHPDSTSQLVVTPESPAFVNRARSLAEQLGLPLLALDQPLPENLELLVRVGAVGLSIQDQELPGSEPYYIDFSRGALGYRRQRIARADELILKAVGGKRGMRGLKVLDATAGLGRDALVLASAGARVTMCERNPLVCRLLSDAVERGKKDPELAIVLQRMALHQRDAFEYLATLPPPSESGLNVVYLDPMFPPRRKAAKVKKDMQLLQKLLALDGSDGDQDLDTANKANKALLELALTRVNNRVVVKRPRVAPALTELKPGSCVTGRSSRYDIYFPAQAAG